MAETPAQADSRRNSEDGRNGAWRRPASLLDCALSLLLIGSLGILIVRWAPWYCERELPGHTDVVWEADFSNDGTRLITSTPNEAFVWDSGTGKAVYTLPGPIYGANYVDLGGACLLAEFPASVALYDIGAGRKRWEIDTSNIKSAHVSSSRNGTVAMLYTMDVPVPLALDGAAVVLPSTDPSVLRIFDTRDGHIRHSLDGRAGALTSAEFSPDSTRLVTSGRDGAVRIWSVATGEQTHVLKHAASVAYAAFSPDGTKVLAGGANEPVRIWDAESGREVLVLGDEKGLFCPTYCASGDHILTCSRSGVIAVYGAESGRKLYQLQQNVWEKAGLVTACSPDGTRLVSGGGTKGERLYLWDAPTGKQLCALDGHRTCVFRVCFSPDGQRILSAGYDHSARVWCRRRPEQWWGHFYRPEVWLTIIFGTLWLWRVVQWVKERRRPASAPGGPPEQSSGGSERSQEGKP